MKQLIKYIPATIIFGILGWLAIQNPDLEIFEKKSHFPDRYTNMTEEVMEKEQKSIFEEAKEISEKREKMGKIFDELPYFPQDTPPEIIDNFFTSRGTTKAEFLEYYEMPERQLYKK